MAPIIDGRSYVILALMLGGCTLSIESIAAQKIGVGLLMDIKELLEGLRDR